MGKKTTRLSIKPKTSHDLNTVTNKDAILKLSKLDEKTIYSLATSGKLLEMFGSIDSPDEDISLGSWDDLIASENEKIDHD